MLLSSNKFCLHDCVYRWIFTTPSNGIEVQAKKIIPEYIPLWFDTSYRAIAKCELQGVNGIEGNTHIYIALSEKKRKQKIVAFFIGPVRGFANEN